ncbi:MAG: S41 family peptidase [Pirellulales bacterium]
MSRRSLWVLFAVITLSLLCYGRATRNPYGRWLGQAMDAIENDYIEAVDSEKLFEGAMRGMVGRLDDYSSFLPRTLKTYFDEALEQKYGGIGIEVALERERLLVLGARVGGPAYKAGVQAGDVIVGIGNVDTEKFAIDAAQRLLRGTPGTEVTLRVRRAGHEMPLEFRITRALIKVESVLGDTRNEDGTWDFLLPGEPGIGYLRITSFGDLTFEEFCSAIEWLRARKCRGVIIDLRNNPGGLLDQAEELCNAFLPANAVIVTTRGRDARVRKESLATGNGPYQDLPMVLLVNGQSASASEIVAACLQDHQRAKVVGQRTFGKGTVQNLIPIEAGQSSLKLTIATYWRPSEKNIHRMTTSKDHDEWGVRPDPGCEVPLDEQQITTWLEARRKRDGRMLPKEAEAAPTSPASEYASPLEFDAQLRRAVEVLKEELDQQAAPKKAAA